MDSVQASSVELRADSAAAGNLASKDREKIPVQSDNTENDSDDQSMKHLSPWTGEADEIKERKEEKEKKRHEELNLYLPLYRAAVRGEWEIAKEILENDPHAATAKLTWNSKTVLQVAVSITSHAIYFVEKLLDFVPKESLLLADDSGNTALSAAASAGNTEAVKLLLKKNPDLLQIRNKYNSTPLHEAARCGHEEAVRYLYLSETQGKEELKTLKEPSPFTGKDGVWLLNLLIFADFYDIALDLLNRYPKLALGQDHYKKTAFIALANKPLAFASGSRLRLWQRIIYHFIPVEMDNVPCKPLESGDVENPTESSQKFSSKPTHNGFLIQISTAFGTLCRKVNAMLWITLRLVPWINHIHEAKLTHKRSLELVKCICKEVTFSGENPLELLTQPLHTATKLGIHEIVAEIIRTYPHVIWCRNEDNRHVFALAVLHRREKIYSLLYQIGSHKQFVARFKDKYRNNLLHLAAKLEPSTNISGPALQMQREVQWFKVEVEKFVEPFVEPSFKESENKHGETPRMVFTKEHKELVKQGGEWMTAAASSSTVVAALIVTVVFAAAFTVPGGNDSEKGIPLFINRLSFMVFAISDAIALFSSSTSLLMFLGILTSRYSEEDFLKSLPTKLIIGLITLFISIATMMIAFSATLYIALVHRVNWVLIPIAVLACLTVTSFAFMQFPILVEIALSTYGPSIFRQRSEDIIL